MHVSRYDRRFHAAGIGVLVIVLTGWLVVYMIAVTRQGT